MMMLEQEFFYVFAIPALICAVLVILSKNPVLSVLYLILTFVNGAFILLLMECDFLALLFTIVYLGAIAILFLFIVMMLDITYMDENLSRYFGIGINLGLLCFVTLHLMLNRDFLFEGGSIEMPGVDYMADFVLNRTSSIELFGHVLYTDYAALFIIAGMILLLAMISAIVLTIHSPKKTFGAADLY